MGQVVKPHYKALYKIMDYVTTTAKRELNLQPKGQWNSKDKKYKFQVTSTGNTEFYKDKEMRKNVGGHIVYLNLALVTIVYMIQRIVVLSVTEAELIQVVKCAKDMLFMWRLLLKMDLEVKLPMILEADNQGDINMINNWSSSGRTCHIDCNLKFLHKLKQVNILRVIWKSGKEMRQM